jgi:hypothetical protein
MGKRKDHFSETRVAHSMISVRIKVAFFLSVSLGNSMLILSEGGIYGL